MSGYKRATVNISRDEYDRLRDAELKLRSLPEVNVEKYQEISQQSENAFQLNLTDIQERQGLFENLLVNMDEMIQELENSTSQAMVAYEANTIAEVQEYAGNLWDHFSQVIDTNNENFKHSIAATHQRYQAELAQYSRRVRRMAGSQAKKRMLAREWLEAADQFCEFIKQNYNHEQFKLGRVSYLERELEQARQNMDIGLSEAVIINAQQLYRSFSDLRIELEQLEAQWNLLRQSAIETLDQIVLQAKESWVVPAVDLDGHLLSYSIQVDFWTQGKLSQFIKDLEDVKGQLENEPGLFDIEILQHFLQDDLPSYYHSLENIILDGRITALNSQLRINIADLVVRSLQEQGFALEEANYEADDMRMAYDAQLVNLEGNKVTVQVVPAGWKLGENELHLKSFDREERTEHELQRRWYEVSQALSSYGLAVGSYVREDAGEYSTRSGMDANQQGSSPNLQTKIHSQRSG